jgi:hypothetical protein
LSRLRVTGTLAREKQIPGKFATALPPLRQLPETESVQTSVFLRRRKKYQYRKMAAGFLCTVNYGVGDCYSDTTRFLRNLSTAYFFAFVRILRMRTIFQNAPLSISRRCCFLRYFLILQLAGNNDRCAKQIGKTTIFSGRAAICAAITKTK